MQSIFDIAGSAMQAQSIRLNVTATNLANANSVASTAEDAFKARQPVFAAVLKDQIGGLQSLGIVESQREAQMRYEPDHPMADEEGYIYASNVDVVEEMANMMSASRSYQTNVELLNTTRQLMLQTLKIGQ